ncbi:MAG: hypothetical protein IPK33_13595 [Gemmatimonadetes bacterium]|nr:hypothetical protein [Gemmatimonadota bacterium]
MAALRLSEAGVGERAAKASVPPSRMRTGSTPERTPKNDLPAAAVGKEGSMESPRNGPATWTGRRIAGKAPARREAQRERDGVAIVREERVRGLHHREIAHPVEPRVLHRDLPIVVAGDDEEGIS